MVLQSLRLLAERRQVMVSAECVSALTQVVAVIADAGGGTRWIRDPAAGQVGLALFRDPDWRRVLIGYHEFRAITYRGDA